MKLTYHLLLPIIFFVGVVGTLLSCSSFENRRANRLQFKIITETGQIEIELYKNTAPNAVKQIVKLINVQNETGVGYYDGLSFDYTKPHLEIIVSKHPSIKNIQIKSEINAESLKLHQTIIGDKGEAMDVMQQVILKSVYRGDKHRKHHPKLQHWLDRWNQSYDPSFLIGVSSKEINESMGYVYTESISSKPVIKGSIVLKPTSKTWVSPRMSIILQDMPERTGKWMVIGHVSKGLSIADKISTFPLVMPREFKTRQFIPKKPVVITAIKPLFSQ